MFGHGPSKEEMFAELHTLDKLHTIWLLCRLNLLLALDRFHADSKETIELQTYLINALIDEQLFNKLKEKFGQERLDERRSFHHEQVLILLRAALLHGGDEGGRRPDIHREASHKLGRCLLMTNDLLSTEESAKAVRRERPSERRRVVALQLQLGPGFELNNPPEIRGSVVRSDIMFGEILSKISTPLDIRGAFRSHAGLDLQEYMDLVFGVLAYYISRSQGELRGVSPQNENVRVVQSRNVRFHGAGGGRWNRSELH